MNDELLEALELVTVGPAVIVLEPLVTDVVNPELDPVPVVCAVLVDAVFVPPAAVPVAEPEGEPLLLVAVQAARFLLPLPPAI